MNAISLQETIYSVIDTLKRLSVSQFSTCDPYHAGLYDWPPFVIAPGCSVMGILLMAGVENVAGIQLLGQTTLEEIAAAAAVEDKINTNIVHTKAADVENNMKLNL